VAFSYDDSTINIVVVVVIIIIFLNQGKTPGSSKITKICEKCLGVNPTLAGNHQQNHHAAEQS